MHDDPDFSTIDFPPVPFRPAYPRPGTTRRFLPARLTSSAQLRQLAMSAAAVLAVEGLRYFLAGKRTSSPSSIPPSQEPAREPGWDLSITQVSIRIATYYRSEE